MATLYDNLIGGRGGVINYNTGSTTDYPTSDQYNIFPSLYLPRVYGKDLSAFEIASSGKISVTLKDIYSFDLDRNTTTSNVTLQMVNQDSLTFNANNSNVSIVLNGSQSNNLDMYAACNVNIVAGSNVNISGQGMNYNMDNIYFTANSNIGLTAKTNSIQLVSGSNITSAASNNTSLLAKKSFSISANDANSVLTMNNADYNVTLATVSNVTVGASNNLQLTSGNNTTATVGKSFLLTADGSGMSLNMDSTTDDITISTVGDQFVYANSNITVSAGDVLALYGNNSNVSVVAGTDNTLRLYSLDSTFVSASNNLSVAASNVVNVSTSGVERMRVTAAGDVGVGTTTPTGKLEVRGDVDGTTTFVVTNSNNGTSANPVIKLTTDQGDTGKGIIFKNSTAKTTDGGVNTMTVRNDGGSLRLQAKAGGDSNGIWVSDTTNYVGIGTNAPTTVLDVVGDYKLSATTLGVVSAGTNIQLNAGGAQAVEITSNYTRIKNNLQIWGVVDSMSVTQTTLSVVDKTINLATASNGETIVDGNLTNDKAGLVITGLPSGETDSNLYEKSFRWNNNIGGVPLIGTAAFSNDAYWELKGGGLRITHTKPATGKEVGFGFRVNDFDELELYKKYWDTNTSAYLFKRIAKFGRTL